MTDPRKAQEARTEAVRQHEAAGCPLARELRVLRQMCSCHADDGSVDEAEARYLELVAAWNRRAHPAPAATGEGVDAQPPSNEVWPPEGAVWLAPVATDAPANPSLLRYAWGRSNLSTGQMAEAYQCIVSAAQQCGQVYRLPVATPAQQGGAVTEAMVRRAIDAFARVPADPTSDTLDTDLMRAALNAALNPGGEGND